MKTRYNSYQAFQMFGSLICCQISSANNLSEIINCRPPIAKSDNSASWAVDDEGAVRRASFPPYRTAVFDCFQGPPSRSMTKWNCVLNTALSLAATVAFCHFDTSTVCRVPPPLLTAHDVFANFIWIASLQCGDCLTEQYRPYLGSLAQSQNIQNVHRYIV